MNNVLKRMMDDVMPSFNETTVNGMVRDELEQTPWFLDKILKDSIRSLPRDIQFEYTGFEYVTPDEEITSEYKKPNSAYDLARSDVYPVDFKFMHKGEEITKRIFLPYGKKGNLLTMSGTQYVVAPVLSDTIITPETNQVFARLIKDKISFKSIERTLIFNQESRHGGIIYAPLMKNTPDQGPLGRPISPIAPYLCGKYGFRGAVLKYFNKSIQELREQSPEYKDLRDVTEEDVILSISEYPELRTTHNVYESRKDQPTKTTTMNGEKYRGTDVKIYIHKDIPITPFIETFVFGIMYILEVIPDESIGGQYGKDVGNLLYQYETKNLDEEMLRWRHMISMISNKGNFTQHKLREDVASHFNGLEQYIDSFVREKLRQVNIYVEDFFDFLYEILSRYKEFTSSSTEYSSDIRKKYLDVQYCICYDIFIGFNKTLLSLDKQHKTNLASNRINPTVSNFLNPDKDVKKKGVEKSLDKEISSKVIYKLINSKEKRFNMLTVDSCGSSMIFKCSGLMEDQNRGDGVKIPKTQDGPKFPGSMRISKYLDYIFGSMYNLPKKTPSPRFRVNPFLQIDPHTGRLILTNDILEKAAYVDQKLKGKTELDDDEDIDREDNLDQDRDYEDNLESKLEEGFEDTEVDDTEE